MRLQCEEIEIKRHRWGGQEDDGARRFRAERYFKGVEQKKKMTIEGVKWETTSTLAASHFLFIFLLHHPATTLNTKLPPSLLTIRGKKQRLSFSQSGERPKTNTEKAINTAGIIRRQPEAGSDDRAKRTAGEGGSRPPGRLHR